MGRHTTDWGGGLMTAVPHWASRSAAVAALAAGAIGVALELAQVDSPVRGPLVLLFLVSAPGLAVAGLLPGIRGLARLVVAVAAAIVIDTLVATVMLVTGVWSTRAGLLAVAVISAAGLAWQLPPVRARVAGRSPAAGEPAPGDGSAPPPAVAGDAVTAQFGPVSAGPPAPAPLARWARANGGAPARANGEAPARPADEATVQMPAVHPEPRADEVATARYAAARPHQPGAEKNAGPQHPADGQAGAPGPTADGAGSSAPAAGPAGSPAPADGGPSGADRPASTDDATVQFPAIRGDE